MIKEIDKICPEEGTFDAQTLNQRLNTTGDEAVL
jgi:hypothetical protein